MKEYVKILLYAYPLLKTVGEDYEEHIRNKAVLSYKGNLSTEELAEYLVGELIEMRSLEWLKAKMEEAISGLKEEERTLIRARYFREEGVRRTGENREGAVLLCSERTYFRRLKRAEEKFASRLTWVGLSEQVYEEEFAGIGIFKRVTKRMQKMRHSRKAENNPPIQNNI